MSSKTTTSGDSAAAATVGACGTPSRSRPLTRSTPHFPRRLRIAPAARGSISTRGQLLDHLDYRSIGDPFPVGHAAAPDDRRTVERREELRGEPRLADARDADDGEETARALGDDPVEVLRQQLPLRSRPTSRPSSRRGSGVACTSTVCSRNAAARPSSLSRFQRREVPRPRRGRRAGTFGGRSGSHRALQPAGVACRSRPPRPLRTRARHPDRLPRPRPCSRRSAPRALCRRSNSAFHSRDPLAQLDRGPDCPESVVLAHHRYAEHRHDLVPDEFLHRAAVPLDYLGARGRRSPTSRAATPRGQAGLRASTTRRRRRRSPSPSCGSSADTSAASGDHVRPAPESLVGSAKRRRPHTGRGPTGRTRRCDVRPVKSSNPERASPSRAAATRPPARARAPPSDVRARRPSPRGHLPAAHTGSRASIEQTAQSAPATGARAPALSSSGIASASRPIARSASRRSSSAISRSSSSRLIAFAANVSYRKSTSGSPRQNESASRKASPASRA